MGRDIHLGRPTIASGAIVPPRLLGTAGGSALAEFMDSASVAPRRADAVPHWDLDADVVVVGLGCAGASAAIEARTAGADVVILERAGAGGGTSAMSGGVL